MKQRLDESKQIDLKTLSYAAFTQLIRHGGIIVRRIDAHQHYWRLQRGDYDWLTPQQPLLYRDYMPEQLLPALNKHQIAGTIVVQAAQTVEETEFLLELSEHDETIVGVVGWLDLQSAQYKKHFEHFRGYSKFVGIRLMLQEMEDASRVLADDYVHALKELAALDFPVDLLLRHHQLPVLIELLERVPNLRGVIDHLAKPPIAAGELHPWKEQMRELAQHRKLYCKLSGMVTEASEQWKLEDFVPYVEHIIDCFGAERIMYGSDWPVCLLAAQYEQVLEVLDYALPKHLSEHDKAQLYGGNAASFYRLAQ